MAYPGNKSEKRLVELAVRQANANKPIRFFVGSCPDYSHNGEVYTHKGLGEDIPFLTQCHLNADSQILTVLEEAGIPFKYTIMVADVEAIDEVFCDRFTDGNEAEFLRRCRQSQENTQRMLESAGVGSKLNSSSFFDEFGRDKFMHYQQEYQKVLMDRYETDGSFRTRVDGDLYARFPMYREMYPFVFQGNISTSERDTFLISRTLRTMAQYLTLGRLIGQQSDNCYPMIIGHPTRNRGVYNERNKFLLAEDGPQPQPTIPIFEMKKKVY